MPFASKHVVAQPVSEILGEARFHACPRPKQRVGSSRCLAPAMLVSPGQDDLLLPYTSRYFDTLLRPWKRSGEVLKTVVMGLYPLWDISQAAVSTADTFLGRVGDDRGPLRRWVLEAQADVTRALAARALDAQASAINDR